jgi:hypothetical protein
VFLGQAADCARRGCFSTGGQSQGAFQSLLKTIEDINACMHDVCVRQDAHRPMRSAEDHKDAPILPRIVSECEMHWDDCGFVAWRGWIEATPELSGCFGIF